MTNRKPSPPGGLTVERLLEALRKHDYGGGGVDCGTSVDEETDPSHVIIDGHYDLLAVVDELNGAPPKRPARRKRA